MRSTPGRRDRAEPLARPTRRKRPERRAHMHSELPRRVVVLAAVIALIAGCSTSSPSSSLRAGSPAPSQATVTTTPTAAPSISPAATSAPTPSATPVALDPFVGTVVVTVSDDLVVRSEPWVGDDSVMYRPWLPIGTELKVLSGPVSGSGYTWYEVEPVSFTGLDGPGQGWVAMAGNDGEPWIALAELPPMPTGVRFDVHEKDLGGGRLQKIATVTWRAPRSEGVEIRVYGVTECLSMPAQAPEIGEGPCLLEHTRLPASALSLAATAPASTGRATWTWIEDWSGEGCQWYPAVSGPDGSWYESVVLAAYNASGHSIFAIAAPGSWCRGCIIC